MVSSFKQKFDAMMNAPDWLEHPVWDYNTKLAGRELASHAGVDAPEIIQVTDNLEHLTPPKVTAVVKPNHGCAGRAVWVLRPDGNMFTSLLHGRTVHWAEVLDDLSFQLQRPHPNRHEKVAGPWLVEHAVHEDRAPADWKAYVIGGRVRLWRQMEREYRNGRKRKLVKHYNPAWENVNATKEHHGILAPYLPAPEDPDGLTQAAEAIAAHVPADFIRVDLYQTDAGRTLFGEITPQPSDNKVRFRGKWDHKLGKHWRRATEGRQ